MPIQISKIFKESTTCTSFPHKDTFISASKVLNFNMFLPSITFSFSFALTSHIHQSLCLLNYQPLSRVITYKPKFILNTTMCPNMTIYTFIHILFPIFQTFPILCNFPPPLLCYQLDSA